MENTQEQKTPEQWFQMLKEPYRSEAIKGIDKRVFRYTDYPNSLTEALMNCIFWAKSSKPTRSDWAVIYSSIKQGETTYLEPEPIELRPEEPADWKSMYNELKAKYDQLQPKCEKVYFYFDYLDNLIKTTDFEFALHESSEDSPIYKGVFMGKKKSVLVNE